VDTVKYNDKGYNKFSASIYDFPSMKETDDNSDTILELEEEEIRKSSRKSMMWVEDLLAK
jgi:hypothetical protein